MDYVRVALVAAFALVVGCSGAHHHGASGIGSEQPSVAPAGTLVSTPSGHYRVRLDVAGDDLRVGSNTLTLTVLEPKGSPVADAEITVRPWMPLHGHGLDKILRGEAAAPGQYRVSEVVLPMAGVWEFRVQVEREGIVDRLAFGYFQAGE